MLSSIEARFLFPHCEEMELPLINKRHLLSVKLLVVSSIHRVFTLAAFISSLNSRVGIPKAPCLYLSGLGFIQDALLLSNTAPTV